jgi:hypothetical protein
LSFMKLSSAFEPYLTDFLTDDEPVAEFNSDACVQQGREYTGTEHR